MPLETPITYRKDLPLVQEVTNIMHQCDRVALSVIDLTVVDQGGSNNSACATPYVSLAMVAHDQRNYPILCLSDLAYHTQLIQKNNQACLLYDLSSSEAQPLAGKRVSLFGKIETLAKQQQAELWDIYIAAHPDAQLYKNFTDFNIYSVSPTHAHLISGFGHIHWVALSN